MAGGEPTATTSLWSRKCDLVYFAFFVIHVPIVFLVDAAPLLPSSLQCDLSHQLRAYYVSTYNDKFFEVPTPTWFTVFITMEIFYHTPLSLWAIGALLRDDPMVPVHLLAFGVQSFVTSLPCLAEIWSWTDRSLDQKQNLTMLYAPYVALGAFMALDMVSRLRGQLTRKAKSE